MGQKLPSKQLTQEEHDKKCKEALDNQAGHIFDEELQNPSYTIRNNDAYSQISSAYNQEEQKVNVNNANHLSPLINEVQTQQMAAHSVGDLLEADNYNTDYSANLNQGQRVRNDSMHNLPRQNQEGIMNDSMYDFWNNHHMKDQAQMVVRVLLDKVDNI